MRDTLKQELGQILREMRQMLDEENKQKEELEGELVQMQAKL